MIQAFTDLVGTSAVPAHAFDIAELTELTPALDTATSTHGTSAEASEAANTRWMGNCSVGCDSLNICVL
jgi:hypothetical protein